MIHPARPITRRHFLNIAGQSTAAIGAGCLFADSLGSKSSAAAASERALPPVVVFSKVYQELKLNFQQSAEVTAEAGLGGIDCPVRAGGEIVPEQAVEAIPRYAEALARHGTKIRLLTTGILDVDSPHARDILSAGKKLDIRYYRLGYWYHRPGSAPEKLLPEIHSSLKELAVMNRELGVCALFQNHSVEQGKTTGPVGSDLIEMYNIVKDFDPDQIGVAFDLGHAIITHGDAWREHFERLKDYIRVIYVKDVQRPARFVPFGQGEFGHTDFFQLLIKMNYRAPLSIHIEYPWAPEGQKTRAALVQTLKESRRVLAQWWQGAQNG